MKNRTLKIGIPSKGRLKDKSLSVFKKNKIHIKNTKRSYISEVKNFKNNEVVFSHAREIIERLSDGSLDVGISGFDLLNESLPGIKKHILIYKRLSFGFADLVVAVPQDWIDVQTIADLEEISFNFKDKIYGKLRIATKYPNLTNEFLTSKGVTQYKVVNSLGATEIYPFTNQSEIITDITSSGATLKANKLRILKDGFILKSSACILVSKKSLKDKSKKLIIYKFLKKINK
ncbi:ATP phosphoribosyltransferase [Pelagibacteraceae bacterium]|jgi:ATP phosphoribosyltransferase|nr:ATP phosphoribosyltransferase [Pelagibacteraceae bacterium]|tara:strand:- start:1274 stop:1969 length:696 start_codon:yes stop_codon:yes gene_type:complete